MEENRLTDNLFTKGMIIVALIILGKVIAFGKIIVISNAFGTTDEADAFFLSLNITTILFTGFSSTIAASFLPSYNEKKLIDREFATDFASNIISMYMAVCLIISAVVFIYSFEIISLFSPSSFGDRNNLASNMLRVMVVSFSFSTFVGFLMSIELSHKLLYPSHWLPLVNNLIVVVSLVVLAPRYGLIVAAFAGTAAWIIQVPVHLWILRGRFKYKLGILRIDSSVVNWAGLFAPIFLCTLLDQAGILIDTTLASPLSGGSISSINYANRLITFSTGIFVAASISVFYPIFSDAAAERDRAKLRDTLSAATTGITVISFFTMCVIVVYHVEIVQTVFERGSFQHAKTILTSKILLLYGVGIFFWSMRELLNRVFYSLKEAKKPLLVGIIMVAANVVLSINLVDAIGLIGLPLATSISFGIGFAIQLCLLKGIIGGEYFTGFAKVLAKTIICSAISVGSMVLVRRYLEINLVVLRLIVGVCVGGGTYFLAQYLMLGFSLKQLLGAKLK